jgi:hypothetical protein
MNKYYSRIEAAYRLVRIVRAMIECPAEEVLLG